MFFTILLSVLSVVACSPAKDIIFVIVGGQDVDIKDAPYQVSLRYNDEHICGGSIVTNNVIITAAHCLKITSNPDFKVQFGSTFKSVSGTTHAVSRFVTHPDYGNLDYDVGLVWLSEPITFSDVVKPIEMANVGEEVPDGGECAVYGWGLLKEHGHSSEILQRVVVPKVSNAVCKEAYASLNMTITPRMLCAGVPEGGKDACKGDSGGPLVYNNKLAGIVSFGIGCARPNYPGVYSDVAALREWIDENIAKLEEDNNLRED